MTIPKTKLPRRVLLKGFDQEGHDNASAFLASRGVEVINLPSLADMVIAGPQADAALLEKTKTGGPKAIAFDELRALLSVATGDPSGAPSGDVDQQAYAQVLLEGEARLPIERTATHLRVLDIELPIPTPPAEAHRSRVPAGEQFAHLCLDQPLLESLRAVALGVRHGMPVALEGETAASKTTAVLYLAHLLGQPAVRLNLHGHSDASELVGRYVPSEQGKSTWRFQEGYLPQAMRHGWWLLLDEVNLAETQVLERLNCALETPPSLILSEGPGTDVPVAPGFRLLCTMNPSHYAGRALLSQAFIDRWGLWHQAGSPGEREVEAMLRLWVFGQHPRVITCGRAYKAGDATPVFGELQQISNIDDLVHRLAIFHHGVVLAAGGDGKVPSIGRLSKQRQSFSRRTLHNLVRMVVENIRAGVPATPNLISDAIRDLYIGRLRDSGDRRAVQSMMVAGGLS